MYESWDTAFVAWCFAVVLLARALAVFPVSLIVNYWRRSRISFKMQFVMWWVRLLCALEGEGGG